jgi:hypothetical protein
MLIIHNEQEFDLSILNGVTGEFRWISTLGESMHFLCRFSFSIHCFTEKYEGEDYENTKSWICKDDGGKNRIFSTERYEKLNILINMIN